MKTEPEIEIEDAEILDDSRAEPETSELTNELTEDDSEQIEQIGNLVPATEIKLSFSPGKLNECFV